MRPSFDSGKQEGNLCLILNQAEVPGATTSLAIKSKSIHRIPKVETIYLVTELFPEAIPPVNPIILIPNFALSKQEITQGNPP